MVIKSLAKINSILNVLRKRDDGYHELFTVMHKINLYDVICVEKNKGGINLRVNVDQINNKNNLAFRAAELFFRESGIAPQVNIEIDKRIPMGGGLGGGSSNAASVLRALNFLFDQPLNIGELHNLASKLGSDVPFFLYDGTAIAKGRGEIIKPISCDYENCKVLLVTPNLSISTAYVYKKIRLTNVKGINKMATTIEDRCNMSVLKQHLHNDLESVVLEEFDLLRELKKKMLESVGNGLVSGSGSSIFSIIDAEVLQKGKALRDDLRDGGFCCEIFEFA